MSNLDVEALIQKLYEGRCSREEMELLFDHIKAHPEQDHKAVMTFLWEKMEGFSAPTEQEVERMLERSMTKIKAPDQSPKKGSSLFQLSTDSGRRIWWIGTSAAATIALLLAAGLWYFSPTANLVTITTAFAEQQRLTLPDGSTVELNANSSISFQESWENDEKRIVWLTGEAFFHVTKKQETGQKFCVLTDDLTVEVLGTSFNVNTHHEETKVFLEEGQVKLNFDESKEEILMAPGELVTYSQKTQKPRKLTPKTQEPSSWRDGFVLLEETDFLAILQKINEIYGLTHKVVQPAHLTRQFTIAIPIDSYETMLSVLKEVTGLSIKRSGDQLLIE